MKKIKLLIAMLTTVAIAKGGSITLNKDTIYTWQEFVSAVIMVESTNNPKAYNKRENAVGILQIRPIMVREVNNVRCCEDMTRLEFYERVARKWNGGYRGMEKTATIKYWNKIKKELIKFGKQ